MLKIGEIVTLSDWCDNNMGTTWRDKRGAMLH